MISRWFGVMLGCGLATVSAPSVTLACSGSGDYLPSLLSFSDRLPGRSLGRILLETGTIHPPEQGFDEISVVEAIRAKIGTATAKDLVAEVDTALANARKAHAARQVFNRLHDMRDLFAANAVAPAEMQGYLNMRFRLQSSVPPADQWERERWPEMIKGEVAEAAALIDAAHNGKAPAGLLPHYLYLAGAAAFRQADDKGAEIAFQRVIDEFPDHPRAEVARFMVARSAFSQSIGDGFSPEFKVASARAMDAFAAYRAKHPEGRFIGDVLGWEGGLHSRAGRHAAALRSYARQLTLSDHPELARGAIPMCEKCFEELSETGDLGQVLSGLLDQPALATALVYHMLWFGTSEWRYVEQFAQVLSAAESHFVGDVWHPRFLAILAQALSAGGRQTEALALLDKAGSEASKIEDWVFARAIVLERADRLPEARAAWEGFFTAFPQSEWVPDARAHLAMVLADLGLADEAIVAFDGGPMPNMLDPDTRYPESHAALSLEASALYPTLNVWTGDAAAQAKEALWYFAPVEELARLAKRPGTSPEEAQKMEQRIGQRLIAERRYAEAGAHLPGPMVQALHLDELAGAPEPARKLEIARAWAGEHERWMTKPSVNADWLLSNAQILDLKVDDRLARYDERRHAFDLCLAIVNDQTAPGPTQTDARKLILDLMPRLARHSFYTIELARRDDWSSLSQRLWMDVAKAEPTSTSAWWNFGPSHSTWDKDRWIYDPRGGRDWLQPPNSWGAYPDWVAHPDFFWDVTRAFSNSDADANSSSNTPWGIEFSEVLGILGSALAEFDQGKLTAQASCATLLQKLVTGPDSRIPFVTNALRDILLVAAEDQASEADRAAYCAFRLRCLPNAAWGHWNLEATFPVLPDFELLKELPEKRGTSGQAMLAAYWDALEISLRANAPRYDVGAKPLRPTEADVAKAEAQFWHPLGGASPRDWPGVEKLCEAFLTNHARSPKREAVAVHLVRAKFRSRRPWKPEVLDQWRELGFGLSGRHFGLFYQHLPWDPTPARQAIAAYRAEFPSGALKTEVDEVEGLVAWHAGDYVKALQIACAAMTNDASPNVRIFGEALFVHTVAEAERPEHRAACLDAIRAVPASQEPLCVYLEKVSGNPYAPLAFMAYYLLAELER